MYKLEDVRQIHLEITQKCQAACSMCDRNINGGELNPHLTLAELKIDDIKRIFKPTLIKQLQAMQLCGNHGDPIIAEHTLEVLQYFREHNKDMWLSMNTNAGAREEEWWKSLAETIGRNGNVIFSVDGLEDTNHLYRQNVKWKKLEDNYTTFIREGGNAAWQFIVFEHNKHQIDICRDLSVREGFKWFNTVYSTRENHEVEAVPKDREKNKCIRCKATYDNKELKESFYIDALGTVWPCCWMATNYQSNVVAKQIGYRFGHYLSHNLKYDSLENIVQGDMFAFLWKNLSKFEVCNTHCLHNISDTITWHGM